MRILNRIFGQRNKAGNERESLPREVVPDFEGYNHLGQIIDVWDYILNSNDQIALKAAETVNELFTLVLIYKNRQLYEITVFKNRQIGFSLV